MFRVQFFVDDKRLGEVLRLVSGKVTDLEQQPVVNATKANGKTQAQHPSGTIREAVILELRHDPEVKKTGRFTVDMIKALNEKLGGSAKSTNTQMYYWKKQKLIKKISRGVYSFTK